MSESPQVIDLLLRWEELRDAGQDVSAEELCADDPELLDAVSAGMARLRKINALLNDQNSQDDDKRRAVAPDGRRTFAGELSETGPRRPTAGTEQLIDLG